MVGVVSLAGNASRYFAAGGGSQLPMVTDAWITHNRLFYLPDAVNYGLKGNIGVSQDGTKMYVAGGRDGNGIYRVIIPATDGATATVDISTVAITGDVSPDGGNPAGVLHYGGRVIVSGFVFYDATNGQTTTHKWMSEDLSSQQSDFQRVGASPLLPGMIGGHMMEVPDNWKSILGYPAITGVGPLSIITRTNAGPSGAGFDPAEIGVTVGTIPATALIEFPHDHPLDANLVNNDYYHDTDRVAGGFIPAESRSLCFLAAHGHGPQSVGIGRGDGGVDGPYYGEGTADPDLNGDPSGLGGFPWCWDEIFVGGHGDHAAPYTWRLHVVDLNTQPGLSNPWDAKPAYYDLTLPQFEINADVDFPLFPGSLTYSHTLKQFFVARKIPLGDSIRVDVFDVGPP